MQKNKIILAVVGLTALGAGFFGGMQYEKSVAPSSFSRQNFQNLSPEERQQMFQGGGGLLGGGRAGGSQQGGGPTSGEIVSKDDKSITVKLQNGGSRIVFLSDSTEITKSASGSLGDLAVGKQVFVNGSQNSDGSVTAQSIQIGLGR